MPTAKDQKETGCQGGLCKGPGEAPGTTERLWEKGGWKSCEVRVVIGKVTGEADSRMSARTTRLSVGLVLLDVRVCGAWWWQRWVGRGVEVGEETRAEKGEGPGNRAGGRDTLASTISHVEFLTMGHENPSFFVLSPSSDIWF